MQYLEFVVVHNPAVTKAVVGDNFWMQGGSVQVHGQFWHGMGAVGLPDFLYQQDC
jgi:hypothetical protein